MAKERIGVVGAGLMGAEIALVYALAGHDVLLSDTSEANLAAALTRLRGIAEKGVARGFYKAEETAPALARIATTTDLARFADRDMVTEAVFEDEAVKAAIWRRLDAVCGSECLFATNTSSIAISALASYVGEARRARFLGTHYFSPVSRMKLVEIIPAFETGEAAVKAAMRRRQPRRHRHCLPPRPRPPDGSVRADGRDDDEPVAAGPGDPVRGLRRTLPPAGAAQAEGQGGVYREEGREGLAN
jgi:3-hydroxybutyryl-CoA dehydrogenase